jgi:hypothetical protein
MEFINEKGEVNLSKWMDKAKDCCGLGLHVCSKWEINLSKWMDMAKDYHGLI